MVAVGDEDLEPTHGCATANPLKSGNILVLRTAILVMVVEILGMLSSFVLAHRELLTNCWNRLMPLPVALGSGKLPSRQ
jgi:hypothetical protein